MVTTDERENQLPLNCFTKWCQWAKMIIRVDKCVPFGIKNFSSRSLQFQPTLFIDTDLLPVFNSGKSFKYLGRYFNFEMENENDEVHLKSSLLDMMNLIDSLRILPKNRLLLYQRYVLSRLSWHLTVADLSKTWVIDNLDNVVVRFVRKWLDLPISGTLSGISLPRKNFSLNLLLPSVKLQQCQTVLRNVLKSSSNDAVKSLLRSTSFGMNIQYDTYRNTTHVLKAVRQNHTDKFRSNLTSQGFIITFIPNHSLKAVNSLWSSAQSKLPKNISKFAVRYLTNTLATRKNLTLWNPPKTSNCSCCLQPESLLHVFAGCKTYLDEGRFTWRHDSALNFLASSLQYLKNYTFYVDLPQYLSPCLITGDNLRPDMLISSSDTLYAIVLSVCFETNLNNNTSRKFEKYRHLLHHLRKNTALSNFSACL